MRVANSNGSKRKSSVSQVVSQPIKVQFVRGGTQHSISPDALTKEWRSKVTNPKTVFKYAAPLAQTKYKTQTPLKRVKR